MKAISKRYYRIFIYLLIIVLPNATLKAESGYRLWLRYDLVSDPSLLAQYRSVCRELISEGSSETIAVAKKELITGLDGLLGKHLQVVKSVTKDGGILIGTPMHSALITSLIPAARLKLLGDEGFLIVSTTVNQKKCLVVTANTDIGVLYGVFHLLKQIQSQQNITHLSITSSPKIKHRILDHWDNLNRTVERGYAGFSIWDWQRLPGYIDQRYIDYARANASVGINGTVLNNVNANAQVLTEEYLPKVQALANAFRPYGIKVYLSARFSAPIEIGGLKTADPLDSTIIAWWKSKVDEIYTYIPDFGGFLIKANSEGQPGPQNYGRNHADGANMLADALAPHGGIVMWRAFVYDDKVPDDRFKQAYNEFKPLDGKFRSNVLIQVKNGPIDFQPREPFHPLFGAMPKTPLMMEFQITQEYLGFATHLVYLGTLYQECLNADTYAKGKGSTVAKVIEGNLDNHSLSAIAGVANIGTDINWCGHPFAQANWYAYGRLAWDPELQADKIAEDWLRMTFTSNARFLQPMKKLMMDSRENTVNYMTPLGLHHIMGWSHHYGPGPWVSNKPRADWTAVYYHKADTLGIGFDRTSTGSNALSQYFPEVEKKFSDLQSCPEEYLLWFHHVNWNYRLKSGKTLWNELCYRYYAGVDAVKGMQKTWDSMEGTIDPERFQQVKMLLAIQKKEAEVWRNSCVLYFQTFSKMPIPKDLDKPDKPLEYYQNLNYHFVPGN
jgi:alpha-glucuronidase